MNMLITLGLRRNLAVGMLDMNASMVGNHRDDIHCGAYKEPCSTTVSLRFLRIIKSNERHVPLARLRHWSFRLG